ncbi:MAG: hypothetical protein KKA60_00310 [Proteobacteria bacterium]|nr:hypothetical protein [Pseudomonadota bacterium]
MPGSMQQTPSSGDHGTAMQGTGDHGTMEGTGDHGAMEGMGNMATFHHTGVAEGIRAEFQIMTLASMNTTDPGGATHHVMVRFFDQDTGDQVMGVAGRVKIVSPSKEESMADLKDYSGVMAANFMATEPGQYGIICLFRQDGKNRVVKFWYPMEK